MIRDVRLKISSIELNQIVVKAGKRDPAYGIMQKVIAKKKRYARQINACQTEVYVKATEQINHLNQLKEENDEVKDERPTAGYKALQAPRLPDSIANYNFIEMQIKLNYQAPNKYKEERTAYQLYGNDSGLFIPNFAESDFNFYKNYVALPGVTELPVISPLSNTAILSYKYKLIKTLVENGQSVFKIKVIPRKKGNATCSGYIYINDQSWNINRLEIDLPKNALKFFDYFDLQLSYQKMNDTLWLPQQQQFSYRTKKGKKQSYAGNTLISYSNHQLACDFPNNFFGNEVALSTQEAYERDSIYWQQTRTEPLTLKQTQVAQYRDSVDQVINSKPYKDSVQAVYNKIEPLEILWFGVGLQNHEKKRNWYISSLASLSSFNIIGGIRLGPSVAFSQKMDDGQFFRASGSMSIGIKHKDLQGFSNIAFTYNPHRLATAYFTLRREFAAINFNDAFRNIVQPSNFLLEDQIGVGHRFELANGLYLKTKVAYKWRQPISERTTHVFENWFPNEGFEDVIEEPVSFNPFEVLITDVGLSYTPAQKYITEPDRKLVLGSKFPTFSINYQKGWNRILGSDTDFDYVEFAIDQDLILGQFGNSKYRLICGTYLNNRHLSNIDEKRFRQSDYWWYSNPLTSFQRLDTALSLSSKKAFVELHHIHHFNGALINNIPLIKKTGVRLVAGGGFLWMQENQYRHEELFVGIERIFKLGPRRRMRLGVYGVGRNNNIDGATTGYKFAIDIIDTWKKDWSY